LSQTVSPVWLLTAFHSAHRTSIIVQTSDMVLSAQLCLVCTRSLEGRLG